MPTAIREDEFRFYFVSDNRDEKPHVYVEHDAGFAKFWLGPTRFAGSANLGREELLRIYKIVEAKQKLLLEAWHDHFNG